MSPVPAASVRCFLRTPVVITSRQQNPSLNFPFETLRDRFGIVIAGQHVMSEILSHAGSESVSTRFVSAPPQPSLRLGGTSSEVGGLNPVTPSPLNWRGDLFTAAVDGLKRRWRRERRRRNVGRAYDMALEIARVIPNGAEVLDVGCGNGFIAHHLRALLGTSVVGIDVIDKPDVLLDYRRYDGARFPLPDHSCDAALLCYVLHHAQGVDAVLCEVRRVLRHGGMAVVYEDIPENWWDKGVCWIHNQKWRGRTGPCTFRRSSEWRSLFTSYGFEIVSERQLSRWRNLTHPVGRGLWVLSPESRPSPKR